MWDNASVAKSTGGVRLVGPEARMSERGREEGKSNTAAAISVGKPELNQTAAATSFLKLNCPQIFKSDVRFKNRVATFHFTYT